MGLNCAQGPTPEPDGTCDSCRAIVNNSSMDVVEMDAASNRGIDEIRDLRDRVNLAPVSGRVKVYIIDEVHMLTVEAFNALLKMLEEPPEHVVFVLATTEKHKVLPTIISRCQSFDFRRPGVPVIAEKLSEIADAENIEAEPEALNVIAGAGGGSFRDAEGLLDQLSSFSEGEITAAMVRELLGSVGSGTLIETTAALHERRAAEALRILDRLSNEGRDPGQFVTELLSHLRNLMLLPHAPEVALAGVGTEEQGPLREQADAIPTAEAVRMIEALGDALGRMKRGGDPKLELELTFLKLARDYIEPSVETLMSRLEALELAVANGNIPATARAKPAPNSSTGKAQTSEDSSEPSPSEADSSETGTGESRDDEEGKERDEKLRNEQSEEIGVETLSAHWGEIVGDLKRQRQALTATVFQTGRPVSLGDGVLKIAFSEDPDFYVREAGNSRHRDALTKVLREKFGIEPRLEFEAANAGGAPPPPPESENSGPQPESETKLEAPQQEVATPRDGAPRPEPEEPGQERPEAKNGPEISGSVGADDRIRDEQEAFEFVRNTLGNMNRDGGSR